MLELQWKPKDMRLSVTSQDKRSQLHDTRFSVYPRVFSWVGGAGEQATQGKPRDKTGDLVLTWLHQWQLGDWNSRLGSSPEGALWRKSPEITQSGSWRQHWILVTGHWFQSGRGMELATRDEWSVADGLGRSSCCAHVRSQVGSPSKWPESSWNHSLPYTGYRMSQCVCVCVCVCVCARARARMHTCLQ